MLRYQVGSCPKLLPSLTAEWLELLPPVPGVKGSNPAVSGVITKKGYIGGWIYPECFVPWLIPVVGCVFTLRGQSEEYGHALEVDDREEVDGRVVRALTSQHQG